MLYSGAAAAALTVGASWPGGKTCSAWVAVLGSGTDQWQTPFGV
jgi:hypothetical protein